MNYSSDKSSTSTDKPIEKLSTTQLIERMLHNDVENFKIAAALKSITDASQDIKKSKIAAAIKLIEDSDKTQINLQPVNLNSFSKQDLEISIIRLFVIFLRKNLIVR